MKKELKGFLCGAIASSMVFGGALPIVAKTGTKTIEVEYDDIKLVVDGVLITPQDSNGATVEPFIYNGTTYLPVRAVGGAINKNVGWNGTTKTVYIGEMPGQKNYLIDVCPPYDKRGIDGSNIGKPFKMDGQLRSNGFTFYSSGYGLFNLNGKYQTLEFDVGHLDGYANKENVIQIYLDGQQVETITVAPEQLVKHVRIPLNNALQLKIENSNYHYVGFANMELK